MAMTASKVPAPDQGSPRGVETLRALKDIFNTEDPTRPVTVACDQIAAEPHGALPESLVEQDVEGYNYVDRWRDRREKFYSIDRHQFPNRLLYWYGKRRVKSAPQRV